MFKNTLFTILALTMALTTFAAPAAVPKAQDDNIWGEAPGLGTVSEPLK